MTARRTGTAGGCPVARSVELVGDRWTLLLVRDAFDGMRRFGDFQRSLGISRSVLAARLRRLVGAGIFEEAASGGAYGEYVLTAKGSDLFLLIVALRQWGEDHCFRPGEPHSLLMDLRTGKPMRRLQLPGGDGKRLAAADTAVRKLEKTGNSRAARKRRAARAD